MSHLQSKSDSEVKFWDTISETQTDIAEKHWQISWKATDMQIDFWLRFLPIFPRSLNH